MAFDIQTFYRELDTVYGQRDPAAARVFLEENMEKTRYLHDAPVTPVTCPSCVPEQTMNAEYIAVCNEAACFYRGTSDYQRSLECFNEALSEMGRFFRNETVNAFTIRLNRAGTLRLMGRFEESLEEFTKIKDRFMAEETPDPYLMASVCNNMSLAFQDLGQFDDAAASMEEALKWLPDIEDTRIERATTYNNLASVYERQNRLEEAGDAISQSIAILKALGDEAGVHLPAVLNTHAVIAFRHGDYPGALTGFRQALEETEKIYGRNVEYVQCCENLALVCTKMGDEAGAASYRAMAAAASSRSVNP